MSYLKHKPGSIEEMMANQAKKLNDSAYQDMFKKELEKAGKGIGSMTPAEKKAFFNKIDDKYKAKNEDVNESASQVQVKRYGKGNFNLMFRGKEIGYYHKSGSKYMVYYDNEDGDYNQSDEVSSEMQAKKLAYDNMNEEVSQKDVDKFHTKLDKLVHKSFGHSSDEKKKEVKEEDAYDKDDEKPKSKPKKEAVDNPYAVGMAAAMKAKDDKPPLKKSTITKAHDIAKSIKKDEKNEEVKYPHKMYSKDGKEVEAKTPEDHKKYADMGYTHKNETHTFMTKDMNKSKKDAKGEKEIVDPAPKMKFKEAYKKAKKEAMNTVGDATADQVNQRVGEGPKENDPDIKKPKAKADTGSKATPVDTSPEVEYKN